MSAASENLSEKRFWENEPSQVDLIFLRTIIGHDLLVYLYNTSVLGDRHPHTQKEYVCLDERPTGVYSPSFLLLSPTITVGLSPRPSPSLARFI